MLRCPETHEEAFLVMSTGEMVGRMVRSGILGCPVCRREYPILKGVVEFRGTGKGEGAGESGMAGRGVAGAAAGTAAGDRGRGRDGSGRLETARGGGGVVGGGAGVITAR